MQRNYCYDTVRCGLTQRTDGGLHIDPAGFEAICANCATFAVKFDCLEYASDDTPILCGNCGRLRGHMGAVRQLAYLAALRDAPPATRNEVDGSLST